jgi:hypothetical protein
MRDFASYKAAHSDCRGYCASHKPSRPPPFPMYQGEDADALLPKSEAVNDDDDSSTAEAGAGGPAAKKAKTSSCAAGTSGDWRVL